MSNTSYVYRVSTTCRARYWAFTTTLLGRHHHPRLTGEDTAACLPALRQWDCRVQLGAAPLLPSGRSAPRLSLGSVNVDRFSSFGDDVQCPNRIRWYIKSCCASWIGRLLIFLAVPRGIRDLSSQTRDPTCAPCGGSTES